MGFGSISNKFLVISKKLLDFFENSCSEINRLAYELPLLYSAAAENF